VGGHRGLELGVGELGRRGGNRLVPHEREGLLGADGGGLVHGVLGISRVQAPAGTTPRIFTSASAVRFLSCTRPLGPAGSGARGGAWYARNLSASESIWASRF